jgi:hypothetical protein
MKAACGIRLPQVAATKISRGNLGREKYRLPASTYCFSNNGFCAVNLRGVDESGAMIDCSADRAGAGSVLPGSDSYFGDEYIGKTERFPFHFEDT